MGGKVGSVHTSEASEAVIMKLPDNVKCRKEHIVTVGLLDKLF